MKKMLKPLIGLVILSLIGLTIGLVSLLNIRSNMEHYLNQGKTSLFFQLAGLKLQYETINYQQKGVNSHLTTRIHPNDLYIQETVGNIYLQSNIHWGPFILLKDTPNMPQDLPSITIAGWRLILAKAVIETHIDDRYMTQGYNLKLNNLTEGKADTIRVLAVVTLDNTVAYQLVLPSDAHRDKKQMTVTGRFAINQPKHTAYLAFNPFSFNYGDIKIVLQKGAVEGVIDYQEESGFSLEAIKMHIGRLFAHSSNQFIFDHDNLDIIYSAHSSERNKVGFVSIDINQDNVLSNKPRQALASFKKTKAFSQDTLLVSNKKKKTVVLKYKDIKAEQLVDLLNVSTRIANLKEQINWILLRDIQLPEGRNKLYALKDKIVQNEEHYKATLSTKFFEMNAKKLSLSDLLYKLEKSLSIEAFKTASLF